jgi:hypothetical protein
MGSRRRLLLAKLHFRYDRAGELGDPCIYCGVASSEWDHVPPLHYVERLDDDQIDALDLRLLPCCSECNTFLSGIILTTVKARRNYVKDRLRRKYRSWLEMPEWSPDEIGELSTEDARRQMTAHARFSSFIKGRLNFHSKPASELPTGNAGYSGDVLSPSFTRGVK